MTEILSARGLSVNFGGVPALSDFSFTAEAGELLGLIGPNGAGKTTAMRAITGMVRPDAGTVALAGTDITAAAIHQRVRLGLGMSQQLVKPFRSMSALDNVALVAGHEKTDSPWAALFSRNRTAAAARALELLALVGIADAADTPPSSLPLGYLKRLEVARALARSPRLLLLDEPLAGLNHIEAGKMADIIRRLNDGGLSIILIEHNLGEVLRICSRLVVLDNGRCLCEGAPAEVMSDRAVRAAYLGEGAAHA